ncbi:MAG: hypothetical protein IPP69_00840 [Flavobacteriales bacterium]|nr:hypothetical protein [Flavobacteriales bacterium]
MLTTFLATAFFAAGFTTFLAAGFWALPFALAATGLAAGFFGATFLAGFAAFLAAGFATFFAGLEAFAFGFDAGAFWLASVRKPF